MIFLSLLKTYYVGCRRHNWTDQTWYYWKVLVKSGLVGSDIDHVSERNELSTIFEAQLNLNNDRSLEEDILPNAIEEIQVKKQIQSRPRQN